MPMTQASGPMKVKSRDLTNMIISVKPNKVIYSATLGFQSSVIEEFSENSRYLETVRITFSSLLNCTDSVQ